MGEDEAVLRCQEGDREAFHYLVEQYKDVLYGTALLMSSNRALAEEHVQEAFLAAWRGIRGFRRGHPFKPWLVRILVNGVLAHRRRSSIPTYPLDDSTHAGNDCDPQDMAEALAGGETIRRAMAGLNLEHREVVVLRYFADLTIPEVARSLNLRQGTVKSRLHRALGQLRSQLAERDAGEEQRNGI